MTKQEFLESFYKEFPYSCMTVRDMINIVESYPDNVMPFTITGTWSWRGIYADPCIGVSTEESTKEDNLKELNYLLEYGFEGWKGGTFYYEESSLLHVEDHWGSSTTYDENTCYFVLFIKNNEDNPFVQHLLNYFINDKQNEVKYYQDVLGHDLVEGAKVVYYDDLFQKLSIGYIKEIDKRDMVAVVSQVPAYMFKLGVTPYQEITFDRIAQVYDLSK